MKVGIDRSDRLVWHKPNPSLKPCRPGAPVWSLGLSVRLAGIGIRLSTTPKAPTKKISDFVILCMIRQIIDESMVLSFVNCNTLIILRCNIFFPLISRSPSKLDTCVWENH